jgi:AbrB family looped-hinge helix DNA binding protein
MAIIKISKKGWIVIPKEIRERNGLHPGDKVQVNDLAGRISVVPAMGNPIQEIRGMFKGGDSLTEALLEEHRQELEREELRSATGRPATKRKAS